MKKGIMLAIALIAISSTAFVSIARAAGDSAEWTFAASGTAAKVDVSGNGHTLATDWIGITWLADAPAGYTGSMSFNGSQDWLDTYASGGVRNINLSTWPIIHVKYSLKYTNTTNSVVLDQDAANGFFYDQGSFRSQATYNYPAAVDSSGCVFFRWNEWGTVNGSGNTGVHYCDRWFHGCADGKWHTYQADIDPSQADPTQRLKFYMDGVLSTDNGGRTDPVGTPAAFANTSLCIGAATYEGSSVYAPFRGQIADVKIWGNLGPGSLNANVTNPFLSDFADLTLLPIRVDVRDSADTTTLFTQTVFGTSYNSPVTVNWPTIAAGTYLVRAASTCCLTETATAVITGGNATTVNITLVNGDINQDGFIEDQDYSLLGLAWYQGSN